MTERVDATTLLDSVFQKVAAADEVLDREGVEAVEYAEALDSVLTAVDLFLDWLSEHPDDRPAQWNSGNDTPDGV